MIPVPDWIFDPSGWLALATLTALEIVLGVDNLVFIALIGAKLPEGRARVARLLGLVLAFAFRALCLVGLTLLIALTRPVLTVLGRPLSWRDLVLVVAGVFLIVQATLEIHREIEEGGEREDPGGADRPRGLGMTVLTIAVMDLVFSFDSILTAIGVTRDLTIMIAAVFLSLVVMYAAASVVGHFIRSHPTAKVLALSFLVLIGTSLVAEGSGFDLPRGYLYFAMVFSSGVESLNLLSRRRRRRRDVARRGGP